MKFLKKSLVFLLTFIFISSVKIFTFGSAIDYSSMSDGLIPANIAVFASEENFEEASIFLSKLCQKGPFYNDDEILTYQYGVYREFNLNFDLLFADRYSRKGYNLERFIKNHPLALVLIDARSEDSEWKSSMETYLHLIKSYNNEAYIIYSPLNADKLIQEVGMSSAEQKLMNIAFYISYYLEQVLFSRYPEREQVLSVAQIVDRYIPDKFLGNVYDKLIKMHTRGRLQQTVKHYEPESAHTSMDVRDSDYSDRDVILEKEFVKLNENIKMASSFSEKGDLLIRFYNRHSKSVCNPYFFAYFKSTIIGFILDEINSPADLIEFAKILSKFKFKETIKFKEPNSSNIVAAGAVTTGGNYYGCTLF